MHSAGERPTRVGIGLIGRRGFYLIRRRPSGSAMAGFWEFPGGKCEVGELPNAATARECREEAGVEVEVGEMIHQVVHRYAHGLVELNYYRCSTADEPVSGSGFLWISAGLLAGYCFPEANDAVIALLVRESLGSSDPIRDES